MPDTTTGASRERLRFLRNVAAGYLNQTPTGPRMRYPDGSGSPVGRIVRAEEAAGTIRRDGAKWCTTEAGDDIIAAADAARPNPVTTRTA